MKWRNIVFMAMFLCVMAVAGFYLTDVWLANLIDTRDGERHQRYFANFSRIFKDSERHLLTAAELAEYKASATGSSHWTGLVAAVKQQWGPLNQHSAVDAAMLVDRDGERLWESAPTVAQPPLEWLQRVVDDGQLPGMIVCELRCWHMVARPLQSSPGHVLIKAKDMNYFLAHMGQYAGVAVAIAGLPLPRNNWWEAIKNTSNDGVVIDLLSQATREAGSFAQRLIDNPDQHDSRQHYVISRAVDYPASQPLQFILVEDVTRFRQSLKNFYLVIGGVSSLVFWLVAAIIFLLMRGPLRRLQWQVEKLPLLADERFEEFRQTKVRGSSRFFSEIDVLENATMNLSYQLEHLHNAVKVQTDDLEKMAMYDGLTGLANRGLFCDELGRCIQGLSRREELMALLFLDLDKFKRVNDSMGHNVGDELLVQVSKRLQAAVRDTDMVARLGGDEFVVLARNLKSEGDVSTIVEKIFEGLSEPVVLGMVAWQVRTSVGVTFIDSDSEQVSNALKKADMAMYEAKEAGRDTWRVYNNAMQQQLEARVQLELEIPRAIEEREFYLDYQPQLDMLTGKVIGVEGLLRWRHPDMGLLPPDQFVPVLEETGLIRDVGYWVIEECCRAARLLTDSGLGHIKVALNLSVSQLTDPHLLPLLQRCLARYEVGANQMELEITESSLMENLQYSLEQLNRLRELGVCLAIDDFGTGYSSLTYLKKLPVDLVKIDRAFVADILTDPADREIVLSVIRMAHRLGKRIVAEGIETEDQTTFLVANGCDIGQGFLFGRPGALELLISAQQALIDGEAVHPSLTPQPC